MLHSIIKLIFYNSILQICILSISEAFVLHKSHFPIRYLYRISAGYQKLSYCIELIDYMK